MTSSVSLGTWRARQGSLVPELLSDGTIRLQGEQEWLFEGSPLEVGALLSAIPGAKGLTSTLAIVNFGNSVGLFEVPGLGRLEVVSGKWDAAHFDQMLEELTTVAVTLPFSSGGGAALPYDRSVAIHQDVLYHAFVFLRHLLLAAAGPTESLLPALQLILRDPHRRLLREDRTANVGSAREVSSRALARVAEGAGGLQPVAPHVRARVPLAQALRGHLPLVVDESQIKATVDTPENRFVKSFLGLCTGTIEGMRRAIGAPQNAYQRRVLSDCESMQRILRPVLQDPLWRGIGSMVHVPAASTVLQRRRGYRTVLASWIRMRLSTRIPVSPSKARDLLEVKDIAELYELWSYFSAVQALETHLGVPARASRVQIGAMQASVKWEFEVRWSCGVRVFYNPRFSRSGVSLRRSYSVQLRPDIGIEIPTESGPHLHLLDAKFKLDRAAAVLDGVEDTVEEEAGERRGVFKRGDIYKMHTYRDAIVDARSVWVLYPGTDFTFHSAEGGPQLGEPHLLPKLVDGVGAIPLVPGIGGRKCLEATMSKLLDRGLAK